MMRKTLISFATLSSLAAFMAACPASLDDRCANRACEATSSGGEGGADTGTDGPVVDPCVANPTDPECLKEDKAIFVSGPGGDDVGGDGTRAKPYKTISTALAKVTAEKRRIYVCEGNYAEDIALTTAHNGLSLLGAIKCDWTPSDTRTVVGNSSTPFIVAGTSGVSLSGLSIVAKESPQASSIALRATDASIDINNCQLVAGGGGKGNNGILTEISFGCGSHGTHDRQSFHTPKPRLDARNG